MTVYYIPFYAFAALSVVPISLPGFADKFFELQVHVRHPHYFTGDLVNIPLFLVHAVRAAHIGHHPSESDEIGYFSG